MSVNMDLDTVKNKENLLLMVPEIKQNFLINLTQIRERAITWKG